MKTSDASFLNDHNAQAYSKNYSLKPFFIASLFVIAFVGNGWGQCTPSGPSQTTDDIVNFTFGSINNSSTSNNHITATGYSDYTSIVAAAIVNVGQSITATVKGGPGSGNHGATIWIDYNDNGTFEVSERVASINSSIAANGTGTFPVITIGNYLGVHRLRVQYTWNQNGSNLDPCTVTTIYSETEDYLINITPECANVGSEPTLTTALSPTTTNQQVSTAANNGVGPGSRKIYSGFTTCHRVDLFMNTRSAAINCVSGRWLDASGTPLGAWFSINYANSAPGTYTNSFPPMGSTQLEVKTGRSSWVATSAVLNYKYTDGQHGDPTAWGAGNAGSGQWNLYGYNNNGTYNSTVNMTAPTSVYAGYYTQNQTSATDYGFSTESKWGETKNPSIDGTGWAGCPLKDDYFTTVHKRKGFPCGTYTINALKWDDAVQVLVNGTAVWSKPGWYAGTSESNIWTGALDANATVEVRTAEGAGGAASVFSIIKISDNLSVAPLVTTVTPMPNNCGGETITLKVNDKVGKGGEIDHSTWTTGSGGATNYARNGGTTENERINSTDPWGNNAVIWEARTDGVNDASGGWNTAQFPIDNTKTYRYSVWVKRSVIGNGSTYLGAYGYSGGTSTGLIPVAGGAANTNPYFWSGGWTYNPDEWVLIVGFIFPNNYSGTANHADHGLWTLSGSHVNAGSDFKWLTTSTTSLHRSYLYYSTNTTTRQQFAYPRVDVVDGSEPSVQQLLNGFDAGQRDGLSSGAQWKWYANGCGSGTAVGTGASITVAPTQTTSYFVRAEGGSCPSTTTCKEATVYVNPKTPNPTITPSGATTFCQGSNVQLTASDVKMSGNAMKFSGGSYINMGNQPKLKVTGNQTIEMWIKPTDYTTGRQNPYNKAYAGEGTITQEPDGTLNYYYGNLGTDGGVGITNYIGFGSGTASPLTNNQWSHIAIVRDFTNNQLRWYINGVLTNTGTPSLTAVSGNDPVLIGKGYAGNYNGEIDEVRIWNVARTTAQIQANMSKPIQPGTTGLAGYWRFDESSGTTVYDASGYSYSGTMTSSPTRVIPSTAPMDIPATDYNWTPTTGISPTSGKVVTASPTATTTYTVTLTNPLGCANGTATQAITVTPTAAITSVTAGTTPQCIGSTTTYTANGVVLGGGTGAWSSSNTAVATVSSTGDVTAVGAGTCNIKYTITGGCGGTVSKQASYTVNPTPTATISFTPNTEICRGTNITYTTQTGMSNYAWTFPGTSGTDYILISGGTSSSNEAKMVWNVAGSGTQVKVAYNSPAGCASTQATSTTITLPLTSNILATSENATCRINGTNPVHFYDPGNGHYIGSINANGNDGIVTMTSYIHSFGSTAGVDDGTMYSCNSPVNENFRTAFMERSFTVIPTVSGAITGGNTMTVYLPFTSSELNNLMTASTTKTIANTLDDVSGLGNLAITKFHYPGNEDGVPYNNCANPSAVTDHILQNGNGANLTALGLPASVPAQYGSFPVTDFSEFYLHGINDGSPLPITLTQFSGSCDQNVHLSWTTATETNVDRFEIYRSRDGQTWELVGNVEAVGNSSTANSYQITDEAGIETMYYRLRSVDNDGQFEDFNPISVICKFEGSSWNIHPIPASTQATITISTENTSEDDLSIVDMNGRTLFQQEVHIQSGVNTIPINVRKLSEGTYFVKLKNSPTLKPLKFMKVN